MLYQETSCHRSVKTLMMASIGVVQRLHVVLSRRQTASLSYQALNIERSSYVVIIHITSCISMWVLAPGLTEGQVPQVVARRGEGVDCLLVQHDLHRLWQDFALEITCSHVSVRMLRGTMSDVGVCTLELGKV